MSSISSSQVLKEMVHSLENAGSSKETHPCNFRQIEVIVGLSSIIIGMMSHPLSYSSENNEGKGISLEDTLQKLYAAGYRVLIALDPTQDEVISREWQRLSQRYCHLIAFPDFKAPTLQQFDQFYAVIKQEVKKGFPVCVYCGEGWGRTGTMVASLILRHLIQSHPPIDSSKNQTLIPVQSDKVKESITLTTTPLTALAINAVRSVFVDKLKNSMSTGTGENSVETLDQVKSLEALESHLRSKKKLSKL